MNVLRVFAARIRPLASRGPAASVRLFKSLTMASARKVELPQGFLDGPAPCLTKHVIDFKKEGIPVYEGRWAVILDGVLSQEECDLLTKAAEATTEGEWERAMVNVGNGQQRLYEDTRKCGRIIWDNRGT